MKNMENTLGLWIAVGIVFAGISLPWVTLSGSSPFLVSGWNSTGNLCGLSLSGKSVAATAAAVFIGVLGHATSQWNLPKLIPISCCLYGFMYTGFMTLAVANTPNMDPGIGILVTFIGFAALLITALFHCASLPSDTSIVVPND